MTKQDLIAKAWTMRMAGATLFQIAIELKVSKDWLRHYAGMA